MIAQILVAIHTPRDRRTPEISDFMYQDPESRREDGENHLSAYLRAMKGRKHGKSS